MKDVPKFNVLPKYLLLRSGQVKNELHSFMSFMKSPRGMSSFEGGFLPSFKTDGRELVVFKVCVREESRGSRKKRYKLISGVAYRASCEVIPPEGYFSQMFPQYPFLTPISRLVGQVKVDEQVLNSWKLLWLYAVGTPLLNPTTARLYCTKEPLNLTPNSVVPSTTIASM